MSQKLSCIYQWWEDTTLIHCSNLLMDFLGFASCNPKYLKCFLLLLLACQISTCLQLIQFHEICLLTTTLHCDVVQVCQNTLQLTFVAPRLTGLQLHNICPIKNTQASSNKTIFTLTPVSIRTHLHSKNTEVRSFEKWRGGGKRGWGGQSLYTIKVTWAMPVY